MQCVCVCSDCDSVCCMCVVVFLLNLPRLSSRSCCSFRDRQLWGGVGVGRIAGSAHMSWLLELGVGVTGVWCTLWLCGAGFVRKVGQLHDADSNVLVPRLAFANLSIPCSYVFAFSVHVVSVVMLL